MEGESFTRLGNGGPRVDAKIMRTLQSSFTQVQSLLEQNRQLINEINHNQESKSPGSLSRNIGLIRELNDNIRRIVDLYAGISAAFASSSSDGGSVGSSAKAAQNRIRLG